MKRKKKAIEAEIETKTNQEKQEIYMDMQENLEKERENEMKKEESTKGKEEKKNKAMDNKKNEKNKWRKR